MFSYWLVNPKRRTLRTYRKRGLMEFYCVLSVGGLLASYHVQKQDDVTYKAVLRTASGSRNDMPAEIILQKRGGAWQSEPSNAEIGQSLINAIETDGGPK